MQVGGQLCMYWINGALYAVSYSLDTVDDCVTHGTVTPELCST